MDNHVRFTIELPIKTSQKLADIAKREKRSKKSQAELLLIIAVEQLEL